MVKPINIVLTVQDGDVPAKHMQVLVYVANQDTEPDLSQQMEAARLVSLDIDPLLKGRIVQIGLVVDIPLDAGLKAAPAVDADIEEQAIFIFQSSTGFLARVTLPTVDEDIFVPGFADVDLTNTDVDNWLTNMLDGYDGGLAIIDVQDNRGDDLTIFRSGKKEFGNPRV